MCPLCSAYVLFVLLPCLELDFHIRLHGIRDEALVMRSVMHLFFFFARR
jgi:hypothetical protein